MSRSSIYNEGGEIPETKGSMLFGRQIGRSPAQDVVHTASRSGMMYRHDDQSFPRLIAEASQKMGVPLKTEIERYRH